MPARTSRRPPEECANCGAAIPRTAKSCPGCGADERTGWRENEDTLYDGLNLPDEVFGDETSVARKQKRQNTTHVNGVAWYWWCVGVALAVLLALGALRLL